MTHHRPRRAGFTLIELLITILIIGALMAILVPTVFAAFRKAKEAACSAEINTLATALADFKSKFGEYPPSRVLLCEAGYDSSSTGILANNTAIAPGDITYAQLASRSLTYLRKFFPRCTFAPVSSSQQGYFYDFNGDGYPGIATNPNAPSFYILTGSECLVFFLGGMPAYTGSASGYSNNGLVGFGRLPTNPFVASGNLPGMQPNNRTQPLFEFNSARLIDLDGDGIPLYLDTFSQGVDQVPYAYFFSYGSNGYDPNDINNYGATNGAQSLNNNGVSLVNGVEVDDQSSPVPLLRGFTVTFNASGAISPTPNPYTSNAPATVSGVNYINANSFQLFSAGQDRLYGMGGQYSPTALAGKLPLSPLAADAGNVNDEPQSIRLRESDNLTNFSGGRLD